MKKMIKHLGKRVLISTSIAMAIFCFVGIWIDLTSKGMMIFSHYQFTKMIIGILVIGLGYGLPTYVYTLESLPYPIKILLHMGIGLTVYLMVAFYEGWLSGKHFLFELLIQVSSCFVIYFLFVYYYRLQARKLNKALQKKKRH